MQRRSNEFFWPALYIALSFAAVAFCWYARHVLLLTFAGILLAILLQTGGSLAKRWLSISYGWGLTLVILLLALVTLGGGMLFGGAIAQQLAGLSESLPQSLETARQRVQATEWGASILKNTPSPTEVVQSSTLWSHVGDAANAAINGLVAAVVILFVGIYGAADPETHVNGIVRLFPAPQRKRTRQVLSELGVALRWWMIGHLITMTIVGVLIGIGLSVLGVPQPLALALVAFFAELVPNFGPVVAAIPALLLAWTVGTQLVVYVAVLYTIVQFMEGYLVLPLVQRQATSLPPVLSILAVVLFGLIGGLIGVVVATPLMLSAFFLIKKLYVEGTLEAQAVAD